MGLYLSDLWRTKGSAKMVYEGVEYWGSYRGFTHGVPHPETAGPGNTKMAAACGWWCPGPAPQKAYLGITGKRARNAVKTARPHRVGDGVQGCACYLVGAVSTGKGAVERRPMYLKQRGDLFNQVPSSTSARPSNVR